jgi:HSP20 family protein
MDLRDDPQSSVITACLELPGLKPSQITIQLQDEKLMVSGERGSPIPSNPNTTYPVQEIKYGVFHRIIELPQGVQVRL